MDALPHFWHSISCLLVCHWLVIASDTNLNSTSNLILLFRTAFMSHICSLICMSHCCLPPENNALLSVMISSSTDILRDIFNVVFSLLDLGSNFNVFFVCFALYLYFYKENKSCSSIFILILKHLVKFLSATHTLCLLSPLFLATAFLWSFSGPLAWFLFAFLAIFVNFSSLLQIFMMK